MAFNAVKRSTDEGSLHLMFVWLDMLEGDNVAAAEDASLRFPAQSTIQHFHDPHRRVGSAVALSIGAPDKVAWDFYLLYPNGLQWKQVAPTPAAWFHQLQDESWAGPDHYRWGKALGPSIRQVLADVPRFRDA